MAEVAFCLLPLVSKCHTSWTGLGEFTLCQVQLEDVLRLSQNLTLSYAVGATETLNN